MAIWTDLRTVLYSRNTNISGNIIKQNLRTLRNERTHFFIKIYLSHFILERLDVSVVCERWVERHILKEEDVFFPYLLPGAKGANACTPCKLVRDASDRLRVPRSTVILCTLSVCDCRVLITWSPSGYTPVRRKWPDAPSSSSLLIKMWQLTKALGVTRNEPKIHVICYITTTVYNNKITGRKKLAGHHPHWIQ